MQALNIILLIFILGCALAAALSKNLLQAIVIFMGQSTAMCVIWILLESPDLAITEAAVGAGITSLLLFLTLRRLNLIDQDEEHRKHEEETIRQHAALHEERGEEDGHA